MKTTINVHSFPAPKLRNQKSLFSSPKQHFRRQMSSTTAPVARNTRSSASVRGQPTQSYAAVASDTTDTAGPSPSSVPAAEAVNTTSIPVAAAIAAAVDAAATATAPVDAASVPNAPAPAPNPVNPATVPVSNPVAEATAPASTPVAATETPASAPVDTAPATSKAAPVVAPKAAPAVALKAAPTRRSVATKKVASKKVAPKPASVKPPITVADDKSAAGDADEDTRPGEALPQLARAISTDLNPFTVEEQNFVNEIRAKANSLAGMPRISKTSTSTKPFDDMSEDSDAGGKWETVVKSGGRKGKGKARVVSPTPSLSSLIDGDRSPSPGPSRPRARFTAGARRSPKHGRGWGSDSDSDTSHSTTRARSPKVLKKNRVDEFGSFRVTSPAPDRSRSPTPFTVNAVPDASVDDTTLFDLPGFQDQDPAAFISKQNPQQAALWDKVAGSKIRVLTSGLDKAMAGPTVRRAIAHQLSINPDSFNVGLAVGDHQSLIVSGLQPAHVTQLLGKKGCTVPGALIRFKQFALEVPNFIGTLSGFVSDGSSPETMQETVIRSLRAKFAADIGIHSVVAKYRERAPVGMAASAIAQHMAKGLWVAPIDLGVTGGDVERAYNIYVHHPSNHPNYFPKLRSVITKHEFSVVTEYNDEGRFLKNLFKCGISHSIDHPTGLCSLPHLPGWNGPTPLSLDAQRTAASTSRDNNNRHRDTAETGRNRDTRERRERRAPSGRGPRT
ncbi:hypothetical protein C8J56DRAFT_946147 [Mycena floridula]|nr:hypothetical protein C8J56DRAFT_946147 [Mycena floridula]